jgi:uncharacterized protein
MKLIDSHAHLETRLLSLSDLIDKMDASGIDQTILIPRLTNPAEPAKPEVPMWIQRRMFYFPGARWLGIQTTKTMYQDQGSWNMWLQNKSERTSRLEFISDPENESTAEAINQYPARLKGWIFLNPQNHNALETLDKWARHPGMIGIKLHPFWHGYPISSIEPIAARALELRLPILIHLGFGGSGDYMYLPRRFPELSIIFAHLGKPYYPNIWRFARSFPNVYFDVASTYHVDLWLIKRAVKLIGAPRLIFGSDAPYSHPDSQTVIKNWLLRSGADPRQLALMFYENICRIAELK